MFKHLEMQANFDQFNLCSASKQKGKILGKVSFLPYQNAAMLLLLGLVLAQETSFRNTYNHSNTYIMCIECFPEVRYLPHLF